MLTTSFPRFEGDASGIFIFQLARALTTAKQEVKVVAPWAPGAATHEKWNGISVHRFKYSPCNNLSLSYGPGGIPERLKSNSRAVSILPLFTVSFLAKAFKVAQRCDVVHANWLYSGLVAGALKRLLGIPAVLTLRGSDMKYVGSSKTLRAAAMLTFAQMDRVTTVGFAMKDYVQALGLSGDKIETIPNGVDLSLFKPLPSDYARGKLGLPAGKRIILFVGSLTENKGLRNLWTAFKALREAKPNVLLALVGEGALRHELETATLQYGLKEYVLFAGQQPQSQLPLWYNSADLLVLPSFSEGRPNVIMEAMACGIPIAASDIPGIRELSREDAAFRLFKPENTAGIAKAIKDILDHNLKEAAGLLLRSYLIAEGLTWEHSAQKHINCYRKVINAAMNERKCR